MKEGRREDLAEERLNSDAVAAGVSDNPMGRREPSEWSWIEAKGLGISVPLEIFRYGIPLRKRHSLGQGGFLWVRRTLQQGPRCEMAAVNTPRIRGNESLVLRGGDRWHTTESTVVTLCAACLYD